LTVWSVAQQEALDGLRRKPAPGDVVTRVAGVGRFEKLPVEERSGLLQQFVQALAFFLGFGLIRALWPEFDTGTLGEHAQRLGEVPALQLHHKAEDVAALAARAEAAPLLRVGENDEGGSFFVMEGTQRFIIAA
jgi:hypothetical protein